MPKISITRTLAATVLFSTAIAASAPAETNAAGCTAASSDKSSDEPRIVAVREVAAGRYVTEVGGCYDCHTAGYVEVDGKLPDSLRLMGVPLGFRGPWGTSYPANLRLTVQRMTADEFVTMARSSNGLPAMPWPTLHKRNETDLRAIYAYIKSLGAKGEPAPAARRSRSFVAGHIVSFPSFLCLKALGRRHGIRATRSSSTKEKRDSNRACRERDSVSSVFSVVQAVRSSRSRKRNERPARS